MELTGEELAEAREGAHGHAAIVVPDGDDWRVNIAGKFTNQGTAILVARAIGDLLDIEAETRGEGGQIREKDSHGNDPPEIPG
jgi:hypothetical protein